MPQFYFDGTYFEGRRYKMGEPFDEYVDQFALGGGVYGVALNFGKSSAKPVAPGNIPPTQDIGTIRMSLEHFKLMAFLMKRQVSEIEEQLGVEIQLPVRLMNNLKISPEDWSSFWKREK